MDTSITQGLTEHGLLLLAGAGILIGLLASIIGYMLKAFIKDMAAWKGEIENKVDDNYRAIMELKGETRITNELLKLLKEVCNGQTHK